jgi:hypothetical protein
MSNTNFILTGMPILTDTSFTLNAGWNLIGHVYVRDILRRGLFIKRTNQIGSLDSAVTLGWVQPICLD